jgi:peptidoglycan hydrolase-like protein with peptidoglycan-binding domain
MGEKQSAALIELVRYLKKKYPNAKIVGHRDLAATNCPGKNYPLAKVKEAVENTWIEKAKTMLLKVGSRGETVRKLQEMLNSLGFNCGAADGIFGPKTQAAVKAFQKKYGLVADGIVGPLTWAKIAELLGNK